jgi:hypothetical protein
MREERSRIELNLSDLLFGADVRRQVIERLTIVGQSKDSERTMKWLAARGFRIVQSGPYTDREMFPTVDVERFKFVVEREVVI